jgi:ribosome-binding ATPase YchF (GTP1/OBG family)
VQVDPVEDTDVINFELALADISQIEKRQERLRKGRAKTKEEEAEQQVWRSLRRCYARCWADVYDTDLVYPVCVLMPCRSRMQLSRRSWQP